MTMLRVLLVIDDYNELGYLQTLMRKLGFDVDGLQNLRKLSETIMIFNPQIIVVTAKGKKVNGMQVLKQVIRKESPPKMVFLENQVNPLTEEERSLPNINDVLASPVNAQTLLKSLARLGNLDIDILLEKFAKISSSSPEVEDEDDALKMFKDELDELHGRSPSAPSQEDDEPGEIEVQEEGADVAPVLELKPSTVSAEEREQRFDKVLADLEDPVIKAFDPDKVRGYSKQIRAEEQLEDQSDLDEERKAFVRSLFKKDDD